MQDIAAPFGVILAGGAGRRLGGGKAVRLLAGQPLASYAIARLRPQVGALALSGPDDPDLVGFGLPVIPDRIPGLGPIGGILSALQYCRAERPDVPSVLIAPLDCPFLPATLGAILAERLSATGAALACAASGGRLHPTIGLWPTLLAEPLYRLVTREGVRAPRDALARLGGLSVPFADQPIDPFLNVNRPEDLLAAERHIAAGHAAAAKPAP